MRDFRRGDRVKKLPGRLLNESAETNKRASSGQFSTTAGHQRTVPRDRVRVRVINKADDLPQFSLVAVTGMLFDSVDAIDSATYEPVLTVDLPSGSDTETLVVLWSPLGTDDIGDAVLVGLTPVLADISASPGDYLEAVADSERAADTTRTTSMRIAFAPTEAESATHPTVVLLGMGGGSTSAEIGIFKVDADVPARSGTTPGERTLERFEISAGGELVTTSTSAKVINIHADPVRAYVTPADCEPLSSTTANYVTAMPLGDDWLALAPVYPMSEIDAGTSIEMETSNLRMNRKKILAPAANCTPSDIPRVTCA